MWFLEATLVFAGFVGCRVIFGIGKVFIEKVLMSFVRIRSVPLVFAYLFGVDSVGIHEFRWVRAGSHCLPN